MTSVADALGAVTHYHYNKRDQLVEEKNALGGITSMRYDPAGSLYSLTNPNGEEYRFANDAEGRRIAYTGLDGVSDEYELGALGLPIHIRRAVDTNLESLVSFERDKLGRVISRSGESGMISYRYSPGGRLKQIEKTDAQGNTTSKISRVYDSMGRLIEEKSSVLLNSGNMAKRTLSHKYDHAGNRVRSLLPGGEIVDFTPCSSGHVHQISFIAGPDMPEQIISAFERDALNRETLRTQGRLYAKRDYDPLSRIVRMQSGYFDPEGQMQALGVSFNTRPLVSKQFSYDLNGELTQAEDVFNGTQHHAYDALGRITSTKRRRPEYATLLGEATGKSLDRQQALEKLFLEETFLYDRASNLYTTGTGEYGPSRRERPADPGWVRFDNPYGHGKEPHVPYNRIDAIDDVAFFHDTLGRVKEKRCDKSGVTWTYFYDSDNQLVSSCKNLANNICSLQPREDIWHDLQNALFVMTQPRQNSLKLQGAAHNRQG